MLTIGISIFFQHSFFSNGMPTTALSLANALTQLGHSVTLVNTNGKTLWFDDCQTIQTKYKRLNLENWKDDENKKFDIFIDIDGFISKDKRRQIANKVIVFIRKPVALGECEHTVYPIMGAVRNIRDCDAVWTWDHFGKQDAHILEVLSERPVFRVPYTWSYDAVQSYGASLPSWLDTSKNATTWTCHITENNQSTISNCTLPVVIMGYAKTHTSVPFASKYVVHNASHISQQKFFEENVYNHSKREDLTAEFIGRQRISDWKLQGKSFVLSHSRFINVRATHLDCVWNGIPLIHNSPWLRDLGCGLERYYYVDNSVKGATKAIECMAQDYERKQGMFSNDSLEKVRSVLASCLDARQHATIWNTALNITLAPSPTSPLIINEDKPKRTEIVIGFSDLWDSANYEYNFWTLLLQEACNTLRNKIKVRGVKITDSNLNEKIDLLCFGVFGNVWTRVDTSIPKFHITGENTPSKFGPGVFLNLGFEATNKERGIFRFPLWTQYIDWFGADQEKLRNPKTMPIDCTTRADLAMIRKKSKFCAFIVSNPSNKVRNDAFQTLNAYKHVDSAGRLFNNVGDVIFTQTGGGGGGELEKLEFLKDYKFCITYENSRGNGYVTEKLLAAKAAGCIPIYWGAQNVHDDFPIGSFINANDFSTPEELVNYVKAIDENEDAWLKMASVPAIQIDKERKRLAEVAKLILQPILNTAQLQEIPNMLGASSTMEANEMASLREGTMVLDKPLETHRWNENILLVTFITMKFIPSLVHWLASTQTFASRSTIISLRVYVGEDVDDKALNGLRSEYPTVCFKRIPSKSVSAPNFPDLWEPSHFAWKLWLYNELVHESALQNTLVWYTDSASILIRWPEKWLSEVAASGLCMLEDKEQKNEQWCHEAFCNKLNVTESEKSSQQIVGGIVAFICGAKLPWNLFTEAWKWAQQRDVIVGPKWAGILPDGRPYGHRHDQSILSILRLRYNVPVHPLETVYNHDSLRRTAQSGACLYIHRGTIKENDDFAPRIGDVHLINLARRKDRLQRFKDNHESWTKRVCLRPAYDGKNINLTPAIARLFMPNDFLWKKAILGCALSHLSLWVALANETNACENYLILEDDVKFQKGWLNVWAEASKHIPEDYDVLYLGGVLPPNRGAFEKVLEPVNTHWARVAPNQIFGQKTPTRYFHFCNYSYILSRNGAKKILDEMGRRGGYYTSADHMICNRVDDMKHYVLIPQVAGCYQDDDPKYATSEFNNFNRIDNFDSDLWNNDERFSEIEIETQMKMCKDINIIPISDALQDASSALKMVDDISGQIFTVGTHKHTPSMMESKWLEALFGDAIRNSKQIPVDHVPLKTNPTFIYFKQHSHEYLPVFLRYQNAGCEFQVIHLSDEHLSDPIDWYNYPCCKKVIRMYPRKDMPEKVITIPLGPHKFVMPEVDINKKSLAWSFMGTKWQERDLLINPLMQIQPNHCQLFNDWADTNKLKDKEYSEICGKSIFIPCLRGQSAETFRFWEALEHGCIPIYIRTNGDEEYYKMISSKLPILSLESMQHALQFMESLLKNPPTLAQYRNTILNKWMEWKMELISICSSFIKA